jgi:protein-S-isoprenylcysteine O-methyltransferase Ste14
MLLMNLWIFTLAIVLLWGLFIVAKIHAFKFKNFSDHIKKVTTILLFFLLTLTLLWYWIIIFSSWNSSSIENYSWVNANQVNY